MKVQLKTGFLKTVDERHYSKDFVFGIVFLHTNLFHLQISTRETFYPTESRASNTADAGVCGAPPAPASADAQPWAARSARAAASPSSTSQSWPPHTSHAQTHADNGGERSERTYIQHRTGFQISTGSRLEGGPGWTAQWHSPVVQFHTLPYKRGCPHTT